MKKFTITISNYYYPQYPVSHTVEIGPEQTIADHMNAMAKLYKDLGLKVSSHVHRNEWYFVVFFSDGSSTVYNASPTPLTFIENLFSGKNSQ